jgi:hypothetical protein
VIGDAAETWGGKRIGDGGLLLVGLESSLVSWYNCQRLGSLVIALVIN